MRVIHLAHGGPRSPHRLPGEWTFVRDDLTDGLLLRDRRLNERLRSAERCELLRDLEVVAAAVRGTGRFDEVVIWAGPGHAEQLMLPWLVPWLLEIGVPREAVVLAMPAAAGGETPSLRQAAPRDLTRGYADRCPVDAETAALLGRVWEALTAETPEPLVAFDGDQLRSLPLFEPVRQGILARYPDATGLGIHDRALLDGCARRWRPAAGVLGEAHDECRGSVPASRRRLWLRLLRLMGPGSDAGLLEVRCSGRLEPDEAEVRITDAGAQALEGCLDALKILPLCEWIGGVLLLSPHRIWRWTERGLARAGQ